MYRGGDGRLKNIVLSSGEVKRELTKEVKNEKGVNNEE